MKKNIFSVIFIALATTSTVHAQNINSLNNYKYVVLQAAVADVGVPKFQKFKPELETGLKNLLALNNIPLIADQTEGMQRGAKSCDIITCTYTITYSNIMMYGAKISCTFTFTDCMNKEILTVSGTKSVGAAVGEDGYLKLFTEIMNPNNSYKYNYIQPQEQATDKPQSSSNQESRQTSTPSEQSNTSNAQTVKIDEPEWPGDIVYAKDFVGQGIILERQEASVKEKANASMYITGMGKVTTTCSVRGARSTTRIKKQPVIQFVYRYKSNDVNPKEVITVYPLVIKKDTRTIEIGSTGTFTGASSGDMTTLVYKAVKYGKSSYLITLSNYPAGEYAFSLGEGTTKVLYLCGIDE